MRSNKKTGAKSKKEVREQVAQIVQSPSTMPLTVVVQVQAEAAEGLKAISIRHGFVSGKWYVRSLQSQFVLLT